MPNFFKFETKPFRAWFFNGRFIQFKFLLICVIAFFFLKDTAIALPQVFLLVQSRALLRSSEFPWSKRPESSNLLPKNRDTC